MTDSKEQKLPWDEITTAAAAVRGNSDAHWLALGGGALRMVHWGVSGPRQTILRMRRQTS